MRKCFGLTRNLNRCGRVGSWKLFCHEHKKQPIAWVAFITFTVIGGVTSILSYFSPAIIQPAIVAPPPPPQINNQQGNQSNVKLTITGKEMDFLMQQPAIVISLHVRNEGETAVFLNSIQINAIGTDGWKDAGGLRPMEGREWMNKILEKPFGLCIEPGGTRAYKVYYITDKQASFFNPVTINVGYLDATATSASVYTSK